MKKASLILAVLMIISVGLFGCANETTGSTTGTSATTTSSSGEFSTFSIGYNNLGQGVPALDNIEEQARYLNEDIVGNNFVVVNDEFTADKLIKDVQSLISSDVDGIMLFAWVPTAILNIADLCEQTKVPFVIFDQIPQDMEVVSQLEDNPYYVGSVGINNAGVGTAMAEYALEKYKSAVILGGAVGDPIHDTRIDAFVETFEAGGGEVLGVTRAQDPSEAAIKAEDLLSAHPDAECIFTLTGDFATGAITALSNKGLDIPILSSDLVADTLNDLKDGKVEIAQGGNIATPIGSILLQNFLDGHPLMAENGKAPYFNAQTLFFVNGEQADAYQMYYYDSFPLSEDQVSGLLYRYNSDVTIDSVKDFLDNFTMDALIAAHE